jgi:hypothetical protein
LCGEHLVEVEAVQSRGARGDFVETGEQIAENQQTVELMKKIVYRVLGSWPLVFGGGD